MGNEIVLNLTTINNGFIGDPGKGIVVPVYDAETDTIANYVGWMAERGANNSAVWNYQIGGCGACGHRVSDDDGTEVEENHFTIALQGTAPCWQLLFVIRSVLESIGYEVDLSDYDRAPYNRIYLACPAANMTAALPHWTLKEFLEQVKNFLGALAVFDSSRKRVKFTISETVERAEHGYQTADEFSVECSDESEVVSVLSSNLAYSQSSVDYHVYDFIDAETLSAMPKREYADYQAMRNAYDSASDNDKKNYLWRCPQGSFCQWKNGSTTKFLHVDIFGKIVKNEDDNDIEMKIAPAAMSDDINYPTYAKYYINSGTTNHGGSNGFTTESECVYIKMPIIERRNPSVRVYGGATIQDIIEGAEAEQEAADKPDRIDVFFYDGRLNVPIDGEWGSAVAMFSGKPIPMGFTAQDYKNEGGISHESWSLALNPQYGMSSMGDVHDMQRVEARQKYYIQFLSDTLPSAEDIFIFNGKKFLAEKIEATIVNGRFSPLMSGYFYEYL